MTSLKLTSLAVAAMLPLGVLQAQPPQLTAESLVEQVLQGNPGIESLQHAVAAARAREVPAGALDDPIVGYAIAPRSIGVDDLDTGHIVRIEQPLPWFGKRATRRAAARALSERDIAALEAAQQQAQLRARELFADWYLVHEALNINHQQQRALAEMEDTAEGLYRTGLGSQAGVLTASLRREQRVREALALQARQRSIAANINALRNRPVNAVVAPPHRLPSPPAVPTQAALLQALRSANPELARLDAEQTRAAEQAELATLDYRPDIRLTAHYLGTLPREENRGQIGVVLNVPFGRAKRDAAVDAARADKAKIAAQQRQAVNTLSAELATTHAELQSSLDTSALYRSRLIPLAEQAHQAALADYAAGNGSARSVIDAEDDLLQSRLGAVRSETDSFKHWARLRWLAGPSPFDPTAQSGAQEPAP